MDVSETHHKFALLFLTNCLLILTEFKNREIFVLYYAILYVGIAEEDVIVETQAFDPLRVKATPTGRKRASVPAGKSEPAFVFP